MAESDKMAEETEDKPSQPTPAPPLCVVCGDRANGMHYRALTCEGCKTFFRRNARKMAELKCEMGSNGQCVMDLYMRRHCSGCRMKKCLEVGMQVERLWDKERIKTRKPIVKKNQPVAPAAQVDDTTTLVTAASDPAPPCLTSTTDTSSTTNQEASNLTTESLASQEVRGHLDLVANLVSAYKLAQDHMKKQEEPVPEKVIETVSSSTDKKQDAQPMDDWSTTLTTKQNRGKKKESDECLESKKKSSPNKVPLASGKQLFSEEKIQEKGKDLWSYDDARRQGRASLDKALQPDEAQAQPYREKASSRSPPDDDTSRGVYTTQRSHDSSGSPTKASSTDFRHFALKGETLGSCEKGRPIQHLRPGKDMPGTQEHQCPCQTSGCQSPTCKLRGSLVIDPRSSQPDHTLPNFNRGKPYPSPGGNYFQDNFDCSIPDETELSNLWTFSPFSGLTEEISADLLDIKSEEEEDIKWQEGNKEAALDKSADKDLAEGSLEFDSDIFKHIMQIMVMVLKNMTMFAKALPEFKTLTWEDQAALVKGAYLEFMILTSAALYNPDTKCFISAIIPGQQYNQDVGKLGGLAKLTESIFQFADKMTKLKLLEEEEVMLFAICIMTPDRRDLKEIKRVTAQQQMLVEALQTCIRQNHPGQNLFPKALMMLTDVRDVTEKYMDDIMNLQLKGNSMLPLLSEMFSL